MTLDELTLLRAATQAWADDPNGVADAYRTADLAAKHVPALLDAYRALAALHLRACEAYDLSTRVSEEELRRALGR